LCGCHTGAAQAGSAPGELTPNQRAIIGKIAKPTGRRELQYFGATDDVGAVVQLPVHAKLITIVS